MIQKYIHCGLLLLGLAVACNKTEIPVTTSSSLTVVNVMAANTTIGLNFAGVKGASFQFSLAPQIRPGAYQEFSGYQGGVPLGVYGSMDTTTAIFNGILNITPGTVASFFQAGTATAPDTLLTMDHIPVIRVADSAIGVRFIHLSPGGGAVNVTVKTAAGDSTVVAGLGYKGVSPFLLLPASSVAPAGRQYVFSFRDAGSSALLASYTLSGLSSMYFRSRTLVLKGGAGGTGPGVVAVNNY